MTTTFRLGVAVVLQRCDCILMGKRIGSHGAGTWSFPGGHIDARESPAEAGSRELYEETGIIIPAAQMEPTVFTPDVFVAEGKRYVTLYFRASWHELCGAPELREPHKCTGWQWVRPGEWPGELFLPIRNLLTHHPGFLS